MRHFNFVFGMAMCEDCGMADVYRQQGPLNIRWADGLFAIQWYKKKMSHVLVTFNHKIGYFVPQCNYTVYTFLWRKFSLALRALLSNGVIYSICNCSYYKNVYKYVVSWQAVVSNCSGIFFCQNNRRPLRNGACAELVTPLFIYDFLRYPLTLD